LTAFSFAFMAIQFPATRITLRRLNPFWDARNNDVHQFCLQTNNTYTYDRLRSEPVTMPVSRKSVAIPSIDSPSRRRLPPLLRQAWYGLNQALRRRIAHLDLTPDQFTVMRTLLEEHGITQRRLASLISSDPNTVASLVNRMEKAGLLERETHEQDRRANRLGVSRRGKVKYERAREIAVALQHEVLEVLPEAGRASFLEQLQMVAEACRAAALNSVGRK
jgi:DNA-binding MarR family transcriptional regulator